jgi:hypothetical protein
LNICFAILSLGFLGFSWPLNPVFHDHVCLQGLECWQMMSVRFPPLLRVHYITYHTSTITYSWGLWILMGFTASAATAKNVRKLQCTIISQCFLHDWPLDVHGKTTKGKITHVCFPLVYWSPCVGPCFVTLSENLLHGKESE